MVDCVLDTPLHAGGGCIFDDPSAVLDRIVSLTISDPDGNALISLAGLSWAWFDEPDAGLLVAPTDQGQLETTDLAGLLSIPLVGTALDEGQIGTLVLRSDDGVSVGLYNLQVGANGTFIFFTPTRPEGCIFADVTKLTPFDAAGGGGYTLPGGAVDIEALLLDDDRVILAVIRRFLEMVNDDA